MPYGYKKVDALLPVEGVPVIGQKYHLSWGKSNGVVGQVISVNENNKTVLMVSPKTGTEWRNPVNWKDLRHLRKIQRQIEAAAEVNNRLTP